MKFGLFLALLVLLASTNVFGQEVKRSSRRKHRPISDEMASDDVVKTTVGLQDESKPVSVIREDSKSIKVVHDDVRPDTEEFRRRPTDRDDLRTETKVVTTLTSKGKPVTDLRDDSKSTEFLRDNVRPDTEEFRRRPTNRDDLVTEKKVVTTVTTKEKSVTDIRDDSKSTESVPDDVQPDTEEFRDRPADHDDVHEDIKLTSTTVETVVHDDVRPDSEVVDHDRPFENTTLTDERTDVKPTLVDVGRDSTPLPVVDQLSDKLVHVSGNIVLIKYRSSVVDSVQYDVDGTHMPYNNLQISPFRLPYAQDFISRRSYVTLYVSTSKTIDRKLAFAQFPIKYLEDHFPLTFDIDVDLPSQQRGLLERADITLYFFVYITNPETHIDTFLPAGTSQILLQGTNRLVQKLDVFVRANGIEVNGLFRGRFGQRYIQPGTSFQVYIVSEQNLMLRHAPTFDFVAQSIINNVPAMFPVPFSLLVHHQMLKPNIKYYAIGYVFENGIRRSINQEPILVINEQRALITSQVVFSVVPSPFILRGTVTRSMPSSFFLQPRSSLILRLHEIGSDTRDIIFKLPDLISLPQVFQVNISQALRFDPSKHYDMRALIMDERNNIYMASLQPIPLLDEFSKLIIPVDDLLYYVQARLQSSTNQLLNYIPGSTAQIFVTESPETPTKPIVSMRIDSLTEDFREFSIQVPATSIQRGRNYYLVMMIESNGIITHVSKILLISNNQPPPLVIQLPVLSLNLVTGVIFDVDNRPAQWSSSAYANLFLLDDKADNPEKSIVQVWKIHLENDFPVRFEILLDFSRLHPDRVYRLQGAIENGRTLLEYKPAGSVLALNPTGGIISDVRIPVRNVKTSQFVNGLVYINDFSGPLPDKSEIIVTLSSSPSLTNPSIIDELHLKVDGLSLPVNFTMNLPLNKIDINSVYYFLVKYIVRDNVLIPTSQAFAFSPRNEATVVLTLSKTPQIPITGQVTSTGSPLILPLGSTLHLYITDNFEQTKPIIYSEVFLQSSSNSLYEFTMNIDSLILQKKIPLYLRADILYEDRIILSIPRPALLQISPGGEWNINLVIDLPTLLIGQIVSMSQQETLGGEFDVYIQILERGTTNIVETSRIRLTANFPQPFRIEIDNDLFVRYPSLQVRALIKNCKEQVLFESGGTVNIHPGLNIKVDLPVVLTDRKKFTELKTTVNEIAPLRTGIWRLSVTGVVSDSKQDLVSAPIPDTNLVVHN
jgi:hypothetical protein